MCVCVYVCVCCHRLQQLGHQSSTVVNPGCGELTRGNEFSPPLLVLPPESLVSRDTAGVRRAQRETYVRGKACTGIDAMRVLFSDMRSTKRSLK